jgi:preprotein translocase subunit SecA
MTEAAELGDIYKLEVVLIPTNLPLARVDQDDEVYRTAREKYEAIATLIKECRKHGQPVLVGTTSIEKSELVSSMLNKAGIPHQVLNARYHEQEAKIISQAGAPGAVTVATNMAGRGTDIKLGGNIDVLLEEALAGVEDEAKRKSIEEKVRATTKEAEKAVKDAGGLFVLGTERHESRRIDNQLRGRAGRQGDPGRSRFFLSLEDDLMRIFGSDRLDSMLQKLGLEEGEAIVHKWINKALERAQQKVEARNYDIRKHLLKYDDVMNDQRKVIYGQRRELMDTHDASEEVLNMREDVIDALVGRSIPEGAYAQQWNTDTLHEECLRILNLDLPIEKWAQEEGIAEAEILARLEDALAKKMEGKERNYGAHVMRAAEKSILLRVLDQVWKDHLLSLDHLRQGINLRAYAQRDPLNEYKHEAFMQFQEMLARVRELVTTHLSHLQFEESFQGDTFEDTFEDVAISEEKLQLSGASADTFAPAEMPRAIPRTPSASSSMNTPQQDPGRTQTSQDHTHKEHTSVHVGTMAPPSSRNALCPCGSGRRYKQCHGKLRSS